MGLRFRRSGADRGPGDQVRDILRDGGIEKFGRRGQAEAAHFEKKRARDFQSLGDVVGAVQVGIGDQSLPADRRARLFEIDAHDEEEDVLDLAPELDEAFGVAKAFLGIVNGAGTDNREKAAIRSLDHVFDVPAAVSHGQGDLLGHGQALLEMLRGVERLDRTDSDIFQLHRATIAEAASHSL